ncbi:MAG: hypothetical protein IPF47_18600 [Gemmatimonadetes bacterium]|nr:hypothetical protein [Gemmatimonadota bacterium]
MKGPFPLDATRAAWATVSAALRAASSRSPRAARRAVHHALPDQRQDLAKVIAFLFVQHDAYHLGQLSSCAVNWASGGMSYK